MNISLTAVSGLGGWFATRLGQNLTSPVYSRTQPTARGVKDIPERVKRLDDYEKSKAPTKMDFAAIVGQDVWAQHQKNLERVQSLMRESQELAAKINAGVASAYKAL